MGGKCEMACPEITRAIEELESNGLATRPWAMAGLYLGLCQRCPEWSGDGCRRLGLSGGRFGAWLCDARQWCDRWSAMHQGPPA